MDAVERLSRRVVVTKSGRPGEIKQEYDFKNFQYLMQETLFSEGFVEL